MTEIENQEKTKRLNESALGECGETGMMPSPAAENVGNPVTMSISLNASGKDHVNDLMNMLKAAGLDNAAPVSPEMMPMRQDMERLRDIVDVPGIGSDKPEMDSDEPEMDADTLNAPGMSSRKAEEDYTTEPDEKYMDLPDGGGINGKKKMFKPAAKGDNPMSVSDEDKMRESIKSSLLLALAEKKSKPDFLDVDKDGNKKEPMKKALKDKGSAPKKGKVPPQFAKKK